MTERNVLSVSNHPFIVSLQYAFQTEDRLFLVMEYCPGGDLSDYLEAEDYFSEDRARLYAAEIILAIEDLHSRGIIFRDLKPDNVVLDKDGHCKITDFGLSKEGLVENEKLAKSF
jgi:protein-serine/threonine kinase